MSNGAVAIVAAASTGVVTTLATGVAALIRRWRPSRAEEESRAAQIGREVSETMGDALRGLREEREEDRHQIKLLRIENRRLRAERDHLKAGLSLD